MAELDSPPGAQLPSDTDNGHADSPDESLSPTSVIYFKEAYSSFNSPNLSFGHDAGVPPPPPFDFRIERIDSKRRSECCLVYCLLDWWPRCVVLALTFGQRKSCWCWWDL